MIRKFFRVCIILIIVVSILLGLLKRHKFTHKYCNGLYVEAYEVNLEGMNAEYLTDSVNFRIYIGNYDSENENFYYKCTGDSVYIEKVESDEEGLPNNTKTTSRIIEKKTVDLKTLIKQHRFE
jgi:hypothetical protein